MKTTITAITLTLLLSSCFVSKVVAPVDSKVEVANEIEQLPIRIKYRQWYAVFGLIPFANTQTDEKINKLKLTKVRVTTKQSFLDGIITMVCGGGMIFSTQTVILEGYSPSYEPPVKTKPAQTTNTPHAKSKTERLKELKEMFYAKLISSEEYEREKKKILAEP